MCAKTCGGEAELPWRKIAKMAAALEAVLLNHPISSAQHTDRPSLTLHMQVSEHGPGGGTGDRQDGGGAGGADSDIHRKLP